jgi:hypothetical protein
VDGYEELQAASLPNRKFKVVDWREAKYHPANEPVLFSRIRGSPKSLETDAMFLAAYTQARVSIERFSLSDDLKSGLAAIAAEQAVPESLTANVILQKLEGRHQEIRKIRQNVIKNRQYLSVVLKRVPRAGETVAADRGDRKFFEALADFSQIAEGAVEKPEFLEVLKKWGQVDIRSLGMYSTIMALVLRFPGRSASWYHDRRVESTEIERNPAATWEELTSLVQLEYVHVDQNKRYWPNTPYIVKKHKIEPPKTIRLEDFR